ncbi:uncharacterized protein [Mytilus edulis]|uniref:uncharacterized protein n=1 Tax=Mytilus edulis TaxID=6550 RepID=UPI0039F0E371
MFIRKITRNNNHTLLQVLDSIVFGGINGLIENVFPPQSGNYRLLTTDNDISFVKLDFLFYRICGLVTVTNESSCYNMVTILKFIEFLLKSESSPFVVDACKYHYAKISQYAAQILPTPTTKDETKKYSMHKCNRRHLQNSIKTDAVSAWLLYASFYYVTGQYTIALRLIDYVLSRCTLDMVYISFPSNKTDMKSYAQLVHYSVSLEAKMKIATIDCVSYMSHSPFIPAELEFMVEKSMISLPPVVMAHCLRFLSYHHLGDYFNSQKVLNDLFLTVKTRYFISKDEMSDSYTILGVCCEISGDKDTACQHYNEAKSILDLKFNKMHGQNEVGVVK